MASVYQTTASKVSTSKIGVRPDLWRKPQKSSLFFLPLPVRVGLQLALIVAKYGHQGGCVGKHVSKDEILIQSRVILTNV